jgi:peroxiredoxin
VDAGWQILAIAPDKPSNLKPTVDKNSLGFQVFSDPEAEAITGFGLAWQYSEEMREQYKGYGIDLEDASGQKHHILPVPAVYLMDTDGKVLFQYVNPDYKVRIPADVVLAAALSIGK